MPYLRGMKQNIEEPDYRSMNEVQFKYELIKLEKKILDITDDPIDYKHYGPFLDWCRDDAKVEVVEEMMLDRKRFPSPDYDGHDFWCKAQRIRFDKAWNLLWEMFRTKLLTWDD